MTVTSEWQLLPFPQDGSFLGVNGPFSGRAVDGVLQIGLRIEAHHCNTAGMCHGGMLATFADLQLTFGSRFALRKDSFLPTISLSSDFLSGAPLGAWLQGETQVLKTTRNLVFCQCIIRADEEMVLRANGVLKNTNDDAPLHSIRLQEMFG